MHDFMRVSCTSIITLWVEQGPKAPPPPHFLPFGDILGLHCVTWHNFAEPYFMHHWTSHLGPGRRAPTQVAKWKILKLDLSISCNFQQLWFSWQKSPPPSFLPFCERPSSHHTCEIPMVTILQIHTQIPPIWISSLGYQLCQLFKILTYRDVQDTVSWCRWKAYRQPSHNPQ